MDSLLNEVLDAHGGLEHWSKVSTLTARMTVDGPFWALRGFPGAFLDETLTIDVRRQRATFTPWVTPGHSLSLDETQRVTLLDADGRSLDSLTEPRPSYAGYDLLAPWKSLQVGYFLSYAMWNYLTTPYLFTDPGVQAREIEPWQEDGETWRRLHVSFPDAIATHHAEQDFYFGPDGLLRRLDYTVDVNADAAVAHYTGAYRTFDGLAIPTRRRVYRRNPDGTPDRSLPGPDGSAIAIDIHDVTVA